MMAQFLNDDWMQQCVLILHKLRKNIACVDSNKINKLGRKVYERNWSGVYWGEHDRMSESHVKCSGHVRRRLIVALVRKVEQMEDGPCKRVEELDLFYCHFQRYLHRGQTILLRNHS